MLSWMPKRDQLAARGSRLTFTCRIVRRTICVFALALSVGLAPVPAHGAQVAPPPTLASCLRRLHRPCLAPAQIDVAYGIDVLHRRGILGRGRTIAVVVSFGSPTLRADLQAFDRAFGLPNPQLTILAPLGGKPKAGGWAVETTLDVEWAHAVAPAARIAVLEGPVDETEGVQGLPEFLSLERYALAHGLADVISQSWGATEDTLLDPAGRRVIAQFHQFYLQAAARGVSVVAGSGDEGAGGIDLSLKRLFARPAVGYPSSDPLVLAVGGTQLDVSASGAIQGERAWPGSGGGVSKLFPEPAYQRGLPAPVQRLLGGKRGLPDIAADGSGRSPLLIRFNGAWRVVAGTSAATPQWAGLIALADGVAGRDLGPIAPRLYRLAGSPEGVLALRDITSGSSVGPIRNGTRLGGIAFRAGPGWDAVTGLGSPRADVLVPALAQGG